MPMVKLFYLDWMVKLIYLDWCGKRERHRIQSREDYQGL